MSTNNNRSNRLLVVDAVRALALFGVLVMNLRSMAGLEYLSPEALKALQGPVDRVVDLLLGVLLDEKSLSAFSFLFGLSFSLLLERKAGRGGFLTLYSRRLLGLAGFGLLNVAFLYWGDILITYALLGFLLLPAMRLPHRVLLGLAALLLIGSPLILAAAGVAPSPDEQTAIDVESLAVFGGEAYWESVVFGFRRYFDTASPGNLIEDWDTVNVFGLFLLGLWTGRERIPHRLDEERDLLRLVAMIAIPLGLAAAMAQALLPSTSPLATAALAGAPVLAVGYLALATLLLNRAGARGVRRWLAAPGRLALTNYLLYGLFGQLLFYGWALDLIGRMGTAQILSMAIVLYGLLSAASELWLRHFRYGPAEWLWRAFTYGGIPPLRRD